MKREFIWAYPPFPSSHASTLVCLPNGDILAAAFTGSHERNDDVGIAIVKRTSEGWDPKYEFIKVNTEPHWNPVLFWADSEVHLFFKVGPSPRNWSTWYTKGRGEDWSDPVSLGSDVGPVKNKPINISNGTVLAPNSYETETGEWNAWIDISAPAQLQKWERVVVPKFINIQKSGVIQPSLWESEPGNIHMVLRSRMGKVCRSDSFDYGRTWGPVYPIKFPNNNSGIDLVRVKDKVYMVCNPVSGSTMRTPRSPLTVFCNNLNLTNEWKHVVELEKSGQYNGNFPAEFSYPAIISFTRESKLFIAGTYTWNRKNITYWEHPL